MAIINYIPNVKTPTGFDTLNTVSQFTNHVATGVFTNGDTYEINVPAPNDILTGQFVLIFVPDTDSIVGMKISINNGTAIPIDGVGAGSLKTGVATSLLVNTIVGKAYMQVFGVKTPNKNLLHNWDFRNPVNQRGLTTYVRSGASYCIDRWNMPNGDANTSVVVGNGYIEKTFAGTLGVLSSIGQDLEPRTIEGGLIYTLSAFVEAGVNCAIAIRVYNLTTATFILQDSVDVVANTKTLVSKNFVMTGVSPTDTIRIIIGSWTATSLKYYSAKLELGSVSTLANDPPADYGEQLALCQRYCFVTNNHSRWLRASYINANTVYFDIPLPVNMRVNPSIESTSGLRILSPIVSGPEATGFTFAVASASPISSLRLAGTKTAHGLTDAVLDAVRVVFSADL